MFQFSNPRTDVVARTVTDKFQKIISIISENFQSMNCEPCLVLLKPEF